MQSSNHVIETQLTEKLGALETAFDGDVLTMIAPISYGVDDEIRYAVEELSGKTKSKKPKLVVVIETGGGYIEVAERIVNTFRNYYRSVEFVVPDSAMSAGTVIVLSGDVIHMDYYSVLGPIDPQVANSSGMFVPALGYLVEFERLVDKSHSGNLTSAELAFLIQRFDPAELYSFKQARELTIKLLEAWLAQYKFRNWKKTETSGKTVTAQMRRDRAKDIAEKLNETDYWCSHGRGISMQVLRKRMKLVIDDFGQDEVASEAVSSYYKLLKDYTQRTRIQSVIHTREKFSPIWA